LLKRDFDVFATLDSAPGERLNYNCTSYSKAVFLKLFYSIARFSLPTRHFRPPSLIKQIQGSQLKNFI